MQGSKQVILPKKTEFLQYYSPDSVRISYVNHMVPAKKPNAYSITILHQYGTAYN